MASELHTLIEEELRHKNYKGTGNDEEKALIGALRVEARVKEHQHQKKVLTLKRSICIGGGLLVVIVLWVVLALKSKSASKHTASVTQSTVSPPLPSIPPSMGPSPTPSAASSPTPSAASSPTPPVASSPTPSAAFSPTPPVASSPTPSAASSPTPPVASPPTPPVPSSPTPSTASDDGDYGDYEYNFPDDNQLDDAMNKNKLPQANADATALSDAPPPSNGAGDSTGDDQEEVPSSGR
ncbi:hypothetical protein Vretimale_18212 [Volvox reticuliferus]|uniref:Uncharacterized protein n=1 Tax=Volvox reticuliferus TaxID=1737510 RepID=A0A8J4FZC0_9CHLO|nr:hypothetical protein Vretifemale_17971 [Volvox reticuliferus]GIM15439.1 hypothetical protein Vretimale_18212 [Volvox reticuliferus]